MATTSPCDALCVIRIPYASASVSYRAYEEQLASGTILDWAIRRLRAMSPPGLSLICTCDTQSERQRLVTSHRLEDRIDIRSITSRGDVDLCRLLMDSYTVSQLIVVGLGHATGPDKWLASLWRVHRTAVSELTTSTDDAYSEPSYIVRSSLIDKLLTARLPRKPATLIAAASQLKTAVSLESTRARDFLWMRVNMAAALDIEAARWPERISLTSARDVLVLRTALTNASLVQDGSGLVDAWKHATITVRHKRLKEGAIERRTSNRRDRPARVLFVATNPGFTGAQQSLCHLVGALDRSRYEPFALVSHSGILSDELRRRDVHVVTPQENIGEGDVENVVFAKHILEEYLPDILHANHSIGIPLTVAALTLGVPLVQHVRVQTPKDLRAQLYAADVVVAVSDFVRQRIASLEIHPTKIEVVWNGVDVEAFTPQRAQKAFWRRSYGLPENECVVTMIARLSRTKRHDLVIAAVESMRRLLGRGHLVIIGAFDGDRSYQQSINDYVKQLGNHYTHFEFLADVRPVLHASDILTVPSEDEPLSRAVLEGMALGLPVVVSDSGGTKEVIDSGFTGLVVKYGDVASLTSALCGLAEDTVAAEVMGAAAATRVHNSLTSTICANKVMDIYDRVLDRYYRQSLTCARKTEGHDTDLRLPGVR